MLHEPVAPNLTQEVTQTPARSSNPQQQTHTPYPYPFLPTRASAPTLETHTHHINNCGSLNVVWPSTLQANPQGAQAGAPISPTYLPEGRSHRKDLNPDRDQPDGSRTGPKTKPYPGHGGSDGGNGGPGGQLRPPVFAREECIKDIDEFAEAFNKGGVNRWALVISRLWLSVRCGDEWAAMCFALRCAVNCGVL